MEMKERMPQPTDPQSGTPVLMDMRFKERDIELVNPMESGVDPFLCVVQ